jgi:hypothetical protein
MKLLSCAAVRRRLAAHHDGELPVDEQIAVEFHLGHCRPCLEEADALSSIGEALRTAACSMAVPIEETECLPLTVVSRIEAEQAQTIAARTARMFEDMHLMWAGLAATAATVTCAVLLVGLWWLSPPERADSLAGVISTLASQGSDQYPFQVNPAVSLPRGVPGGPVPALLDVSAVEEGQEEDLVFALAAVVTREGRIANPELVQASRTDRRAVEQLMNAVLEARFQPASYRGRVVAVNMVWLFTHTTVRAKLLS